MKRTAAAPLLTLVLVASACSGSGLDVSGNAGGGPDTGGVPRSSDPVRVGTTDPWRTGGGGPIGFAPAALSRFDDCSAFLDHVHREAAERVGPYGFDTGYFGPVEMFAIDDVAEFDVSAPAATDAPAQAVSAETAGADGSSGGVVRDDVSGTNVQVAGVDEPDIVKTDGDRILAISGDVLHYVDVGADGTSGVLRGSVLLSDRDHRYAYGHELFVVGDRAIVFAQGEWWGEGDHVIPPMPPEPEPLDVAPLEVQVDPDTTAVGDDAEEQFARPIEPIEPVEPVEPVEPPVIIPHHPVDVGPRLLVLEVDLSDPAGMRVSASMVIEGRYLSARATGTTARVVVTTPPDDLAFVFPAQPGSEELAEQTNRDIVRRSTIEDWAPSYTHRDGDGTTTSGQLADCARIHAPADFSGFDMLSVVTLDLAAGLTPPVGTTSVLASGETVYASHERLYVTTNVWVPPFVGELDRPDVWFEENYETAIHRFSIAGSAPATYEASGAVEGQLLNQFSMNDRDGVLYAATTIGSPWSETSESQIVALERNGDRLVPIGAVGGLGLGERIFSVRYVGDLAYVVTFRQTDPFYIVDLADPRAMRVTGELKIPGFSSYLHPLGDSLVLGVGQDATDTGRATGAKLSLFDVSDRSNPVELDVWTMPNASSTAEFDHRAFLHWAPTDTVVLPMQSYGDRFAGAIVFDVTAEGIVEVGRISHGDDRGPAGRTDCDVLDAGVFGEDTELFWIEQEGGQVQLCGATDRGGATDMFCEPIPVDDVPFHFDAPVQLDLTGVDRIEFCWPEWHDIGVAVQRTMVIGENVWTLSSEGLQANDLGSLKPLATVDF